MSGEEAMRAHLIQRHGVAERVLQWMAWADLEAKHIDLHVHCMQDGPTAHALSELSGPPGSNR